MEACSACHGASGGGGRGPSLVDGFNVLRATEADLFDAIHNGVAGSEMPPFPFPDDDVWNLVGFVRSLSAPAYESPQLGDPVAGGKLYRDVAGCSGCHRIRGEGGVLGPDLTDIGAARRLDQLREALVSPNELIVRGYEAVRLTLPNGTVVRAIAKNRSNHSAQVLDKDAKLHLVRRPDLDRVELVGKSWMPADYVAQLGEKGIDDLLAFLSEQVVVRREEQ